METNYNPGQGVAEGAAAANPSSVLYQNHNLETVAEESEDAKKATADLNVELFVEDSTKSQLSIYLARLLQRFIHRYQHELEINSFDLLFMTIYCVGLETGFIPEGHRIEYNQPAFRPRYASFDRRVMYLFSGIIPTNFYNRSIRSYRLNLYLPESPDHQCSLVGIKSGDFLCLTFTVPQRADITGKSILLPVSRYIPLVNFQRLNLCCQNLKDLSHKLKNGIFIPVRESLCLDANVAMYPSLNGLPDDVVAILLVYLDKKSALCLAASCSRLRSLTKLFRGQWFA